MSYHTINKQTGLMQRDVGSAPIASTLRITPNFAAREIQLNNSQLTEYFYTADRDGFVQWQFQNRHAILYRVSQGKWTKLRESVPYVELYQYNPKHLYPKLNGYGDNGQRSLKL